MLQRAPAAAGLGRESHADAPQPMLTDEVVEVLCQGEAPPWAFSECFEAPAGPGSRAADFAVSLTSWPRMRLKRALKQVAASGTALDDVRVANGLRMALTEEIEILIFRTLTLEERIVGLEEDDGFAAADRFRSSLRRPGTRRQIFETYPGLLRRLHLLSDRWLASCVEMIDRLEADRQALARTFGIEARDRLVGATMSHGDAHIGGRRVILLRFGSGARLVYKPRPVEAAQRFQALLAFLNREGLKPPLRTIDVLPCRGYGWIEHVSGRSCRTDAGVTRYFRRAGALIAALHVTGGTDCHFENVLADGEHPVVIDLETLMRPQVRSVAAATSLASGAVEDSVLAIGMLPSLDGGDLGALAVRPQQTTQLTTMGLTDAGTPNARVERISWRLGDVPSLPLRRGERVDAADYVGDIENGFTDAYELIAKHRNTLLAPDGIIPDLGRSRIRIVLRPTSFYADILSDSVHPAALYDAAEADRVCLRLRRGPSDALRMAVAAVSGELQQLATADIPYFGLDADSQTLRLGETGSPSVTLPYSGLELARRRLAGMGHIDLARQRGLLRLALPAHPTAGSKASAADDPLQAASAIGDSLLSEAVHYDGGAAWLQVREAHGTTPRGISPTGPWLYDGLLGIGLFLAWLAKATGDAQYRTAAAAAVREARSQLRTLSTPAAPGAFEGLGGLVYAFSHLADLLDDESLLDGAEKAAVEIVPWVERRLLGGDLVAGTAGVCLAALSLASVRTSEAADRLLNACADDLSTMAAAPDDARLPFARGASHGWSGVLLAIARLHAARPSAGLAAALARAIEREALLTSDGLWTDPGDSDHEGQATWCHGAPGTALCRLAAATAVRLDELDKVARLAAEALGSCDWGRLPEFGLCHGAPGVLEAMLSASTACLIPTPHLFEVARGLAAQELTGEVHIFKPSLMTGVAGLGHVLLRIAEPTIPSVLTLDAPNGFFDAVNGL